MQELSPIENEYDSIVIEYEKLRSFVELVSNGKRPDDTYNYCREALEIKAKHLLKNLEK